MNVYTVTNGLLKLTEILVNLFIMGIPILVVRTLDGYRKDRRGRGYYWLAFAFVVAWTQLVFAIVGPLSPFRFLWLRCLTVTGRIGEAGIITRWRRHCSGVVRDTVRPHLWSPWPLLMGFGAL